MSVAVSDGEAPQLDPGETWDPVADRVSSGGSSYQVRRPGMCSLCPRPGRELRLRCAAGLHTWVQALCAEHEARCHPSGEVSCLPHAEHVDVVVLGP